MTPLRRNGIELVEEQHAWLRRLRSLKQVPHALFRCTNVFVKDLGAFHRNKIQSALAGDCGGKERLAAPGVAVEEETRAQAEGGGSEDGSVFYRVGDCFK